MHWSILLMCAANAVLLMVFKAQNAHQHVYARACRVQFECCPVAKWRVTNLTARRTDAMLANSK